MDIQLVAGVGRARTLLSSFDAALGECGVLNYNLIPLSSVLPPRSRVIEADRIAPVADEDRHGDRLYVVKADARSDEPRRAVGAAIGWYQWGDDRGVFVEHEVVGYSRGGVESELRCLVEASLADLCTFRDVPFSPGRIGLRMVSADVEETPTTALVLAVYRAEHW